MRRPGLILLLTVFLPLPIILGSSSDPSRKQAKRSQAAMKRFRQRHPCPSTRKTSGPCPGWQVHFKIPVEHGGAALPSNMHWLNDEERKTLTRNAY